MNREMARRSHSILTRALELDERERATFIAGQCADDPSLHTEVSRLLAAASRSSLFLETPALQTRTSLRNRLPASQPARIGGYRVTRVLGAGGMATVYEAEQQQPRRTVALKVMRQSLARSTAQQRFAFETEALARLRHPGIAQIYEAGTFDDPGGDSLPYFAMELVPAATTITAYARDHRLSLRDVLLLFLDICDAVHHGHQLGVIHRDLKPGNILISDDPTGPRYEPATHGGTSGDSTFRSVAVMPKIIDFGVARSVDPGQAHITRDSDVGRLIGTLNYMAPEQCGGDSGPLDIRCDVYSLGVVLYELIAGRLPHELSRVPLPEAVRIITHESPPPLGRVAPQARGDVEAIVSMAMEKEPARRYASVAALSADVRRFLADQPIDARPATTLTQVRKFARRNRRVVVALAAIATSLVGGIAATSYMAVVADRARDAAEKRERELEQVTAFQQAQLGQVDPRAMGLKLRELLARAVGESARGDDAGQAAREEFERLVGGTNFTTLAQHLLDDSLLEQTHIAIQRQFGEQPLLRARMLHRLALTMRQLGLPRRALEIGEEALEIRRKELGDEHIDTMESQHFIGATLVAAGRLEEAIEILRELSERSARLLGPESDKKLLTDDSLGGALRRSGKLDDAERILSATLETQRRVFGSEAPATLRTLNNLAIAYAQRGQIARAEASWREVLDRRQAAGADADDLSGPRTNLGLLLQDEGKFDEAGSLLEEELRARRSRHGDDHPETIDGILNLASLRMVAGRLDEAAVLQRECLERSRRVNGAIHRKTLQAMGAMASILRAADCPEEAEPLLREALAAQRRQPGPSHPDTIDSMMNLSGVLASTGRGEEAESLAVEAVAALRGASRGDSPTLADALAVLGRAQSETGRWEEALSNLEEAVRMSARVRGEDAPATIRAKAMLQEAVQLRDEAAR